MHVPGKAIAILRSMLLTLIVIYGVTLYLEWNPPKLSIEAMQYLEIAEETASGFDIRNALQKLFWIVGNSVGVLGTALMCIGLRQGLPFFLLCPLFLVAAALLGMFPPAYPNLENLTAMLLWCMTSAAWGASAVYASVKSEALFPRR